MVIPFTLAGQMEEFFREAGKADAPPQDAAFFARFGMKMVGPPLVSS
jgi:hypothetical protein